MDNICQVTNFSPEVTNADRVIRSIKIFDVKATSGVSYRTVTYAKLSTASLSNGIAIKRIGYVCEPRGIDFPIFVATGTKSPEQGEIYLGKTGMFETMPETFLDINDSDAEELDCTPAITEIWVPRYIGNNNPSFVAEDEFIKFKLDYVYSINQGG